MSSAPPTPCSARGADQGDPTVRRERAEQARDAPNQIVPRTKIRRRPKRSPSDPPSRISAARGQRVAVDRPLQVGEVGVEVAAQRRQGRRSPPSSRAARRRCRAPRRAAPTELAPCPRRSRRPVLRCSTCPPCHPPAAGCLTASTAARRPPSPGRWAASVSVTGEQQSAGHEQHQQAGERAAVGVGHVQHDQRRSASRSRRSRARRARRSRRTTTAGRAVSSS